MWGRSVRIARFFGTDVMGDASWLLIASFVVWSLTTSYFPAEAPAKDGAQFAMALAGVAGLIGSLLWHEFGHAVAARGQGAPTRRVTLFLFGGVAENEFDLPTPLTEIWIALAGPMFTLGLALVMWFGALIAAQGATANGTTAVLLFLSRVNLILGLGNLIPAYPLDAGRVLRAIHWLRSGDLVDATRRATRPTTVLSVFLLLLGLFLVFSENPAIGLWPVVTGLFLLSISQSGRDQVQTAVALDGRTVGDLMSRNPVTAQPDQSLSELVSKVFLDHGVSFAPVVENGTVLGYVDAHMVRRIDRENWTTTVVDDLIESIKDENCVTPQMPGYDLLARISRTGQRKFLVVVGNSLVGVITLTDLLAYLGVAKALQAHAT